MYVPVKINNKVKMPKISSSAILLYSKNTRKTCDYVKITRQNRKKEVKNILRQDIDEILQQ